MPACRGAIHHVDLTVSSFDVSVPFYEALFEAMGFRLVARRDDDVVWISRHANIAIHPARPESAHRTHDRHAPGLHHLALNAESRAQVDAVHARMKELGAKVLDPPGEYYGAAYYAVFFADPDGLKVEVVHTSDWSPLDSAGDDFTPAW